MKILLIALIMIPFTIYAKDQTRSPQQTDGNMGTKMVKVIKKCEDKAWKEVNEKFGAEFKSFAEIISADCEAAESKKGKKYHNCEVGVSGKDGGGDKTYAVLLNKSCSKAFSAFLLYEE